ncbi:hypothetical protein F511_35757 [Dorcoceras hygrometricum]|uniref:Uncharacterized protein n=1 Tax=Dorcoceras hygrometricum TaxID=472368 RepID=A0A2Z7B7D2_9LAMI|nr:hypothetical protein F511_35757 [Dorcoceras hygrometricum]
MCAEVYQNSCKLDKGTVAAEDGQADQQTAKMVQQRKAKRVQQTSKLTQLGARAA